MRRILLICFLAAAALGQSFEVASIKPGVGDIISTRPEITNGTFRWSTQLIYLVGYAYGLDFSRVSSNQKNFVSAYNIAATFDASATNEQVRLMLRALLKERFKMEAHNATATAEGYALSVGKGGIKVSEVPMDADSYVSEIFAPKRPGVRQITGKSASFKKLAETLGRSMSIPVWDHTGLAGVYDFQFFYAPDQAIGDAPWIGTALRETLGLNFEKQKGPVETIIVDHIEEPSEN